MKRFTYLNRIGTYVFFLWGLFFFLISPISLQAQSQTAAALGLGSGTRFDAGYSPIIISKTKIVPGTPFNVKPTMDNLVSSSKTSMGGILNRYDTSKFGQFFNSAAAASAKTTTARALPPAAKTNVIGAKGAAPPKLYPPRLAIDYEYYPQTNVENPITKKSIETHLRQILERYPLQSADEQILLVFRGRELVLRGQIHSAYTADVITASLTMEPGIDLVTNEIEILGDQSENQ